MKPAAYVERGVITLRIQPHTAAAIARLLANSEPVDNDADLVCRDLLTILFSSCAQAGFQQGELSLPKIDAVKETMAEQGLLPEAIQ